METRVALTLRMVGGLTVPEIARAFLVQEAAMGQRITRAKAKIKAARIPYRVPSAEDLPARVSGVLAVLFTGLFPPFANPNELSRFEAVVAAVEAGRTERRRPDRASRRRGRTAAGPS